jgi:hypothetical protein
MNLIVKGIESMKDVEGPRDLVIRARSAAEGELLVSVSDTGRGFRHNWRNRYSTHSSQRNPTARAWGFASAEQSLSRMVGACGPRRR